MKKLIYIEDNFLSPELCEHFINLSKANNKEMPYGNSTRGGDTYLTTVDWKNHTAVYHGGNVDPTVIPPEDDVVMRVTNLCKSFDTTANLDYVGVIRWPVGTFMKPHVDDNNKHNPDIFAAMLYLNDDFIGGHTCFEFMEVKPETGKLIVFSNAEYLHYVSQVEKSERFVLSFWYNHAILDENS